MVLKEQSAQYFTIQKTTDDSNMTNLSNDDAKTDKTNNIPLPKTKLTDSFTMIIPQSVKTSEKKKIESAEENADPLSSDSISSTKSMWKTFKRIQRSKKIEEVVETAEEKKMRFKAKKSVAVNSTTVDDEQQEDIEKETNALCKAPICDSKGEGSPQIKIKKPFRALLVRSMTDAERYDSIEDIKTEMDELMKQRSWKNETNKGSKNKLNKQLVKTKKAWKSYEYEPGQLDYDKYYKMKEKHKEKMREKRRKEEVKTQSLDLEKYSALENEPKEDFVEMAIKEREKKAEALIKQKLRRKKEKHEEAAEQNRDAYEFEDQSNNNFRNDVLNSDSCIDKENKGDVRENDISDKDEEILYEPMISSERKIENKEITEKKDGMETKSNNDKGNDTITKPQENRKRPTLARMKKIFEAKNNFDKALKRKVKVKSKEKEKSNEKEETNIKEELKKTKQTNLVVPSTEDNVLKMKNDGESLKGKEKSMKVKKSEKEEEFQLIAPTKNKEILDKNKDLDERAEQCLDMITMKEETDSPLQSRNNKEIKEMNHNQDENETNQGTCTNLKHEEKTINPTTITLPIKDILKGHPEVNDNETENISEETNNYQIRSKHRTIKIAVNTSKEKSQEAQSDWINLDDSHETFCDFETISKQIHELQTISIEDKHKEPIKEKRLDCNNEKLFFATTDGSNHESHKNEKNVSNNDSHDNVETWILLTNGSEISDKIVEKCEQLTKWSRDRGLCDFYCHGDNVSVFITEWREKVAKIKRKKKVRFLL